MCKLENKIIGLETSSIMPLLEITPQTLPLQNNLAEALKEGYKLVTDKESVIEAKEQIRKSYEHAKKLILKASKVSREQGFGDRKQLEILFIKMLTEPYRYGREEALRWSDCLLNVNKKSEDFWRSLKRALKNKRETYFNILKPDANEISIKSSRILPYWASPKYRKDLLVKIAVIGNTISFQRFQEELTPIVKQFQGKRVSANDLKDFYHLISLYRDGRGNEILACDKDFVKKFERNADLLPRKFRVFNNVEIKRIK